MKTLDEKTTIYLNSAVKKSIKHYAVHSDKSLSELINERLVEYLEDLEDIEAVKQARKDRTPGIPFEDVLKELGIKLDDLQGTNKAKSKETAR